MNDDTIQYDDTMPDDLKPVDGFECIHLDITDDLLNTAKIVAYMYNQQINTDAGERVPYNPKKFPEKAVDIMIQKTKDTVIEIYLDTKDCVWDSRFVYDGKFGKLSPEQMYQFFETDFYYKMIDSLESHWPLEDPTYQKLFEGVENRSMRSEMTASDIQEYCTCRDSLNEVDQPGKRVDLANKDVTGDGQRDYSGSGRKILTFNDMGVKGGSGMCYCWPKEGKEFHWHTWKDWKKQTPFCRMTFVYNSRKYMISLSLFDENFDNRGFRGADLDWTPPLAWLTPGECAQVMQLSIVRRFIKGCFRRVKKYLKMTPAEIYSKINKPEKLTEKDIEKTQHIIKHVADVVLRKNQADSYCWR